MDIIEIICKKKCKLKLTKEEIDFLIDGYVKGDVPDYQMSAFCMAVWFNGLDDDELNFWTAAMTNSGAKIDLSNIDGVKVDKHSTGGVADTTSFVALPLAAACGCKVAKMSGRGLGHTGGTLDKLESIPGFNISLSQTEFFETVKKVGLSIIGQTAAVAPADKKMYALRDVTSTVDSIPLICSSIMSKKLASGADVLVLDVKYGNGAFMKNYESACLLAKKMVSIGKMQEKKVSAILSDMNQPLGNAIGNSLEVEEAIEILKGNVEGDLKKLSVIIAAKMVEQSGLAKNLEDAISKVEEALKSGKGLEFFRKFVEAQGGDSRIVDDKNLLPHAKKTEKIFATGKGYIVEMETEQIGKCARLLGAGREKIEDKIDSSVGIVLKKRINDEVNIGDEIAQFYINDETHLKEAKDLFSASIKYGKRKNYSLKLVYSVV